MSGLFKSHLFKSYSIAPMSKCPVAAIYPGMVATFLVKEGKLMVDTHHDPVETLIPRSKDVFGFSSMDATLQFVRDASGKVEKFVFRQGSAEREARKIK